MRTAVLAHISDVPPGTMKSVVVENNKILLANIDGTFHAITSICPHMGADLSKGKLKGVIVICPVHRAGFNVTDGTAVDAITGLTSTIKRKNADAFRVWIENDQVLTEI